MKAISKKLLTVSILCLCSVITVFAQKVSEEEFKRFGSAFDETQYIEETIQKQIDAVIEAHGFTVEGFWQYDRDMRLTVYHPDGRPPKTEKEKRYDGAISRINRLKEEIELRSDIAIINKGLTKDRYTDIRAELYKFAGALREIGEMNHNWQREFSALLKENGFTGDRFNEIHISYKNSNAALPDNEETRRFSAIMARVEEKKVEFEAEKNKAFAANGFNLDRQKEIMDLVLADPAWPKRLRTILDANENLL